MDLSEDAVDVARANVRTAGLDVTVFTVISSNRCRTISPAGLTSSSPTLPTSPSTSSNDLPADVRDHEPVAALIAGPVGDEVLARIAEAAPEWLNSGGVIVCEISEFHGAVVANPLLGTRR